MGPALSSRALTSRSSCSCLSTELILPSRISGRHFWSAILCATRAPCSLLQLAADIAAGRVKQLFIFGGDPVYNAPRALAKIPERSGRSTGPICKRKSRRLCGSVITRMQHRSSARGMSRWRIIWNLGRRANERRQLPVDSADDHAALRRALGNRTAQCATWRPRQSKVPNWSRKLSAPRIRREIFRPRGRNYCTTDLLRTCRA